MRIREKMWDFARTCYNHLRKLNYLQRPKRKLDGLSVVDKYMTDCFIVCPNFYTTTFRGSVCMFKYLKF